ARSGFFQWVEGAPAEGYRAERAPSGAVALRLGRRAASPVVVTGEYGGRVLGPLLERAGFGEVELLVVKNDFFGGNTAVTGLLTGGDVARALAGAPEERRYLLPDVCLSNGRFLDGLTLADLPRSVEVVATDGASLRAALLRRAAA
ncbi:MAG TPA: DUF512 domain-containing protein, partial [Acidimicrobiales bacterium]|nr:DUF512 domain-containing protein [Acidimicrobiales bacterium]